jgi:hypothetical protein
MNEEPAKAEAALRDTVGPEPTWRVCAICGETTSGVECFDCSGARLERNAAIAETRGSIPPAFRWAALDVPELLARVALSASAFDDARARMDEARVVALGRSGSGKTSLLVAMMRARAARRAERGLFVSAVELGSARQRARLGAEAPEVVAALGAQLLLLDDLGTDRDLPSSPIVEVVWGRHAAARPTWVTTWLDEPAMAARYGDGLARRVFEGASIVRCGGA